MVARGLHAGADDAGGFAGALVAELVVFHPRDLNVDVDAVEQRAGDAFLVLGDRAWRAGARA